MSKHKGIDEKRCQAIGERLLIAKAHSPKYRDYTQDDFGRLLGVKGQAVSLWLRGERLPGAANLIELASLLNISLDWLLLNQGQMRREKVAGEVVYIGGWPESAQNVVRGMVVMYDEGSQSAESKPPRRGQPKEAATSARSNQ